MISEQIKELHKELPAGVELIAVSKFHPVEDLREAYDAGQRIFGENHVQELVAKQPQMPSDVEWHLIGHLQTNKVKYIAPFVTMIQAVDSLKLLREIDKQAKKVGRVIPCLLELHVAQEESKFGFSPDELHAMLAEGEWKALTNVSICGIMTMASFTDDTAQVRREFQLARHTFEQTRKEFFSDSPSFCKLSMGMTHDYKIAIEEGATMVRVGTKIFGERQYN